MGTKTVDTFEPSVLQAFVEMYKAEHPEAVFSKDKNGKDTGWRDMKAAFEGNPNLHGVFVKAKTATLPSLVLAHQEGIKAFFKGIKLGTPKEAKPNKDQKRNLLGHVRSSAADGKGDYSITLNSMEYKTLIYVLEANLKQGPEKTKQTEKYSGEERRSESKPLPEDVKTDRRSKSDKAEKAA